MADQKFERDRSLDALRGVAILLIMVCHYILAPLRAQDGSLGTVACMVRELTTLSWSGVDLFFVLSGYLIGGALLDHRDAPNLYRVFYCRRTLRIWPLYGLFLAIVFVALRAQLPMWPFLTMTQNIVAPFIPWGNSPWAVPWLGLTWSLAVEEQFYLVLPLIIRLVPRHVVPTIALCGIVAAPVFRIAVWLSIANHPQDVAYRLFPTRMDTLLLGVLAAWLMRDSHWRSWLIANRKILQYAVAIAVLICAGFVIAGGGDLKYPAGSVVLPSVTGILYFCVLLMICSADRLGKTPLSVHLLAPIGVIAFGLYLFHIPVKIIVFSAIMPRIGSAAATFVSAVSVMLLAAVLWRFVESPAMAVGKMARYRLSPEPGPQRRSPYPKLPDTADMPALIGLKR